MEQNSYPQPHSFTWNKFHVRDTLPIYPPTAGTLESIPALPSPPRKPAFDAPYTLTTHLFPAAYLRTTRLIPLTKLPVPAAGATKAERYRVFAESASQLLELGDDITKSDGYPLVLWNCVNRYVKKDLDMSNKTGVTLFFAHAAGYPKEVSYEFVTSKDVNTYRMCRLGNRHLVVCFLHLLLKSLTRFGRGSLYIMVMQGSLTQQKLRQYVSSFALTNLIFFLISWYEVDWTDDGRDIANFLLYFLPSATTTTLLPVHLQQVSAEETSLRIQSGFKYRKFVAVGHSYGGCTS